MTNGLSVFWVGEREPDTRFHVEQEEWTGEKRGGITIRLAPRNISLYLTAFQAEQLLHDLANNIKDRSPLTDDALGNGALESLIVARDRLIDACVNLGIKKEIGESHE